MTASAETTEFELKRKTLSEVVATTNPRAIRAVHFGFEGPPTTVDATCDELAAAMDYTIFVAPDGPIALECVEDFVGCP